MGVCDTRVLEFHDSDDDTRPVLLVVVIKLGLDNFLLMVIEWLILRMTTLFPNKFIFNEVSFKFRLMDLLVWVIFGAECDDVPHLLRPPVCELTTQLGGLVDFRDEISVSLFLIKLIFEVLMDIPFFDVIQLTDTW